MTRVTRHASAYVPFLSRPSSAVVSQDGGSSFSLSNVAIRPGTLNAPSGIAITVRNVSGSIVIRDVDFSDVIGGIYIYNCTGTLVLDNVRGRNVGDDTIGSGHSNYIQFAESTLDGAVSHCKFLGGRTEDMVSVYHSGGVDAAHPLIIEDCAFQGLVTDTADARAWDRSSGTGTLLGDAAFAGESSKNHDIVLRRCTYLTPGQVGIQLIDGPGLIVRDCTILGEQHVNNNNPMTSYAGNPIATVDNIRHYWTKMDGTHPTPWWGAGTITATNIVQDASLSAAALAVVL